MLRLLLRHDGDEELAMRRTRTTTDSLKTIARCSILQTSEYERLCFVFPGKIWLFRVCAQPRSLGALSRIEREMDGHGILGLSGEHSSLIAFGVPATALHLGRMQGYDHSALLTGVGATGKVLLNRLAFPGMFGPVS